MGDKKCNPGWGTCMVLSPDQNLNDKVGFNLAIKDDKFWMVFDRATMMRYSKELKTNRTFPFHNDLIIPKEQAMALGGKADLRIPKGEYEIIKIGSSLGISMVICTGAPCFKCPYIGCIGEMPK